MPELRTWSWPERGARAELDSLVYQAGRHVVAPKPLNWGQVADQVLSLYPKTWVPKGLADEDFNLAFELQLRKIDVSGIIRRDVVYKSSPGVPLVLLGRENATVLNEHQQLVENAVLERLRLFVSGQWRGLTARQLVEQGFCDPVRLFVKQEPHKGEKIQARRFRLIMSVSLVDQLVERVLSGIQNRAEIRSWFEIPSMPGIGFSDEQIRQVWAIFSPDLLSSVQTDVEGWDWSVQEWELLGNGEMQISLAGASPESAYAECVRARAYCLSLAVFSLSNGDLIAQMIAGIQKSGSYTTGSGNSRMRVTAAMLCKALWARAMGDDCIERTTLNKDEMVASYLQIGHRLKAVDRCRPDSFEFCSSRFSLRDGQPIAEPENWSRTFYRLLNQKESHDQLLAQFRYEMRHSRHLESCLGVLFRVGWYPENSFGQEPQSFQIDDECQAERQGGGRDSLERGAPLAL